MTTCSEARRWIWESLHIGEQVPEEIAEHLRGCAPCRVERRARLDLGRDLHALRLEHIDESPGANLDQDVISTAMAAVAARTSAATMPAIHRSAPVRPPPRISAGLLVAAAALLGVTLLFGVLAGRASLVGLQASVDPGLSVHPTHPAWVMPRNHNVKLSADSVASLSDGYTYLLAGASGGPYEVVGAVSWDRLQLDPIGTQEILLAVAPRDAMGPGRAMDLADLQGSGAAILGRRSLAVAGPW